MESFKNDDLDLRHIAFKFSSKVGALKAMIMNYQKKNVRV